MKTGLILEHTAFTSLNCEIINAVNDWTEKSIDDVCIFSQNISNRAIEPKCAVIDTSEIPSQTKGVLIAFGLSTAQDMIKSNTPAKKIFFVWNPEWIYSTVSFNVLYNMLTHKDVMILVRSEDHAKIVRNLCGKKPTILEELDLEKIHEICRKE